MPGTQHAHPYVLKVRREERRGEVFVISSIVHRSSFIVPMLPSDMTPNSSSYSCRPLGIMADPGIPDNGCAQYLTDAREHRQSEVARPV